VRLFGSPFISFRELVTFGIQFSHPEVAILRRNQRDRSVALVDVILTHELGEGFYAASPGIEGGINAGIAPTAIV